MTSNIFDLPFLQQIKLLHMLSQRRNPIRFLLLCMPMTLVLSVRGDEPDERSGRPVFVEQLGHDHIVDAVAVSPDGRFILSGSPDRTVRLWNFETGKLIRVFQGHTFTVSSVAFSPDSRFAVSGSEDHSVRLWDVETGRVRVLGEKLQDRVTFVAFSGKRVLATQIDYTIVFSSETGKELSRIPLSVDAVSADAQWFAGQPAKGIIEIRNAAGAVVRRIPAHSKWIRSIHFSSNGSRLVTAGDDEGIRVWDTATGRSIARLTNHDNLRVAVLSPDGKKVFAVKGSIKGIQTAGQFGAHILDVATRKALCETKDGGVAARFTADGKHVLVASRPRNVSVLGATDCRLARTMEDTIAETKHLRISPDGSFLLISRLDQTGRVDHVFGLELKTGRLLGQMHAGSRVSQLSFSPDGKRALIASDKALQSWAARDGTLLQISLAEGFDAAFSADGRFVAVKAADDHIEIRNPENGQIVRRHKVSPGGARSLALSSDGSLCAVYMFGDAAGILSVKSGQMVSIPEPLRYVDGLLFSRDSKTLIALAFDGDNSRIRFINTANGREERTVEGPPHGVLGFSLSRDGRFLLLASRRHTVQLRDAATGKLLGSTAWDSHSTTSVEFSADGRFAVVGHSTDMLRFYSLPAIKLLGTLRITEDGTIFHNPDGHFDYENPRLKSRVVFRKGGTSTLLSQDEIPRDLHVPGLFQKTIHSGQ